MKLIIFDFDGTLADTVPHVINCIIKCIEKFGLRKLKYDDILKFNGAVLGNVLMELGARMEDLPEIKEYYSSIFLEDLSDVQLYPNVYDTLMQLKKRGIIITIATNRGRNTMLPLLSHLKLEDLIDFVICESDVENKKPNPDMVNILMEKYGISNKETLIIGDTSFDVLMGQNANCNTCGIYYDKTPSESLENSNPNYLINDFYSIVEILGNIK